MILDVTTEEKQLLLDQFRGYLGALALAYYDEDTELDTWPIERFRSDGAAHTLEILSVQYILKKLVEVEKQVTLTDYEVSILLESLRGILRGVVILQYADSGLDTLPVTYFDMDSDEEEDEILMVQDLIKRLLAANSQG
jgi:hypothetical protein